MDTENEALTMLETETPLAFRAFTDYCRLGPASRSLVNLQKLYCASTEDVPTKALSTLKNWSTTHGWQERVRLYDEQQERLLENSIRSRRLSILDKFGIVVEEALNQIDLEKVSLSQVSGALKIYLDASMGLLNELPTTKLEIVGTVENPQETDTEKLQLRALQLMQKLSLGSAQNTGENSILPSHHNDLDHFPQVTAS